MSTLSEWSKHSASDDFWMVAGTLILLAVSGFVCAQAVREAALQEIMANHSERSGEAPVNLMARTRDKRRPFLLSAIPQLSLIKRYQYYSAALMSLFFVCGAITSWKIKLRLAGA